MKVGFPEHVASNWGSRNSRGRPPARRTPSHESSMRFLLLPLALGVALVSTEAAGMDSYGKEWSRRLAWPILTRR